MKKFKGNRHMNSESQMQWKRSKVYQDSLKSFTSNLLPYLCARETLLFYGKSVLYILFLTYYLLINVLKFREICSLISKWCEYKIETGQNRTENIFDSYFKNKIQTSSKIYVQIRYSYSLDGFQLLIMQMHNTHGSWIVFSFYT